MKGHTNVVNAFFKHYEHASQDTGCLWSRASKDAMTLPISDWLFYLEGGTYSAILQ